MESIILFEDIKKRRIELAKEMKKKLRSKINIWEIEGSGEPDKKRTYESQIEELIKDKISKGALIVCDKDLSDMGKRFVGLSATTVVSVADKLGLPICLYARGEDNRGGEEFLKSLAPWEKKRIELEFKSVSQLAADCVSVFEGFNNIETNYSTLSKRFLLTPASALSSILGQPSVEDRIALYGSGEQEFLHDIMPFLEKENPVLTRTNLKKRMPRILGNWLYTSILRFPGVFVCEMAAASYLNIDHKDFKRAEVKKIFKKAEYDGPFSPLGSWWWRHELDQILVSNKCDDGSSLMKKKKIKVKSCNDIQTKERAGYYCMILEIPVGAENSKGNISWFPSGADLARIRKDKFNELSPWLGLY